MKIAIITGASSGLGVEFFKGLQSEALDEIWIIARREEKLKEISTLYGKITTRCIPLDITEKESIEHLCELFKTVLPDIRFLINNAGMGVYGPLENADYEAQSKMIELNVRSLTEITTIVLPYMNEGAKIINSCSIASFVPNANLTVYSSTKAYVMSFSRGLRYELKKRKINVTALCPGPMETEFLAVAGLDNGSSKAFDALPRCNPQKAAIGAIKAAKRGRAVYTPKGFYKFYRILSKVLPTAWLMGLAKT